VTLKAENLAYRPELDGLRALAILGVLFFHLNLPFFDGGFLGVDVFFVLSGFLITRLIVKSIEAESFSFVDFYIRRARRLFPALLFAAFFTLIIGAFVLNPRHFRAAGETGLFSVLSLSNIESWLSSGGYFDFASTVKPFLHYWSLSVEEQFYLIWPALILLCFGMFKRRIGLMLLALISVLSFAGLVLLQENHYDAVFYLMPFRIWEFGLGALIAVMGIGSGLLEAPRTSGARSQIVSVGLTGLGICIVIFSFVYGHTIKHFGAQLMLASIGAVMIIAAAANPVSKYLLANPVFVYLGKISYSLYLWHWPIIVYLRYTVGLDLSPMWIGVAIALSLLCASLSYRFIEMPYRRPWGQDKSKERLRVPAVLTPITLVFVFVTSLIWNQRGWVWRLSPEVRPIVRAVVSPPRPNCESRDVEGVLDKICFFGEKRDKVDVAVMGDSHGAALAAGMTRHLQRGRLTGVTRTFGGFVPLMNTRRLIVGSGLDDDINQGFEDAFKTNPDYIVLHARFSFYWHTEGAPNEFYKPRRYLEALDGPPLQTIAATQLQFRKGLRETLSAIKAQGIVPILVGPVPNPGVSPVQCLSRPMLRTVEASLASEEEGALFYDPTNMFCEKNAPHCSRLDNNKLVYRDAHHLSKFGASRLGKKIVEIIEAHRANE